MSVICKVNEADLGRIAAKIGSLFGDPTRLYIHQRLAAYLDPYIPKETGTLAQTNRATPKYLEYSQPYAHYQYTGIVYGPNIPIKDEAGNVVGWFSIPGKKKHPTGRFLTYSHEVNQNAGPLWDVRAMAEHSKDFAGDIQRYIAARFNGGGV